MGEMDVNTRFAVARMPAEDLPAAMREVRLLFGIPAVGPTGDWTSSR